MHKVFRLSDVVIEEARCVPDADIMCNHCRLEMELIPNKNVVGYRNPHANPQWDKSHPFFKYRVIWPAVVINRANILKNTACLACGTVGDFETLPWGVFDFDSMHKSLRNRCVKCDKDLHESGSLVRSEIDKKLYCVECLVTE